MTPTQSDQMTGSQFFLTRQTANLMEDFANEIGNGSSLFFIFGDESVGKSRLLQELTSKRIDQDKLRWIDFKSDTSRIKYEVSEPIPEQGWDASAIRALMEAAKDGELIAVDHFELASNKARHALFESWVTDGMDKHLNLIIAANSASFNDVAQLAQKNRIEVKSFQLLPYTNEEVDAFLSFYLFPDNPLKQLVIPAEIAKQIKNCKGIIGKVAMVAAQQNSRITQNHEPQTKSNSRLLVGITLSLLLLTIVAYGFLKPVAQKEVATPADAEVNGSNTSENEQLVANEPAVVAPTSSNDDAELLADSSVTQEVVQQEVIASQEQTTLQPAIPVEVEPDSQVAPETDTKADQLLVTTELGEPEKKVETEQGKPAAEDTRVEEDRESLLECTGKYSTRFQQELEDSVNWIRNIDKKRSTIQIMSLGFGDFTDDTYYEFLEKMKAREIDVSLIRIYPARRNNSIVFGVIYGEYDNRDEARNQIRLLPEDLKTSGPISRTMGGIWNEINR